MNYLSQVKNDKSLKILLTLRSNLMGKYYILIREQFNNNIQTKEEIFRKSFFTKLLTAILIFREE